MLELAEQIRLKIGGDVRIKFVPLPIDDPKRRRPDIGLAWELLCWQPRVRLVEGLDPTIEWFADLSARKPAWAATNRMSA